MKRAIGLLLGIVALTCGSAASARSSLWRFDRLDRIGGLQPTILGHPKLVDGPDGKAMAFNGVDDAIYLARHPLAGAKQFTIEAVFRPDGGTFAQRWLHLASDDPVHQTRMLFEIRVVGDNWYLDSFIKGQGYSQVLIDPARLHPIGRWYHVAQSFDGRTYRSYVNGVLEAQAEVSGFVPQGRGGTSVGVRYNRVDYFRGAVRAARFTSSALPPSHFMKIRKETAKP